MHSEHTLHVTWDSLGQHLAERAQIEARIMAGFTPKPWRVPREDEQVDDTIDWCATP